MTSIEAAKETISRMVGQARETYEENKKTASPESIAFDAGRYDGLKQALEAIENVQKIIHA